MPEHVPLPPPWPVPVQASPSMTSMTRTPGLTSTHSWAVAIASSWEVPLYPFVRYLPADHRGWS